MNIERDIQSLTDFKKNTPEFVQQLKDTGEPIILTINGKAELVVQDAASYQKLIDLAEQTRVLEGIRRGLADVAAGRTQPLTEALADLERINFRVDQRLKTELEAEAREKGVSPSEIILQALEKHLRQRTPRENCLQLAERLGILGVFKDLPMDLSTNPIHMEGFGRD